MSDKSLLWLWTHCRAIGMTKKADASEIDSLAMDIALFTADQKGEIERLRDELETFRLGKHHTENAGLRRELAEARGLAAEALDALNSTEETCIRFSDLRGRLHEFYSTSDQPSDAIKEDSK